MAYRYSVWVKRTGSQDGITYHAAQNTNNLDGTSNSASYFWYGDPPELDQWYLLVGVVHPHNYAGGDSGLSGVYDIQGNKVADGSEFKWDIATTTSRFRSYLFYSIDTGVRQYFYNPILQKLDGNEASLEDIIFEPKAPDIVTPVVYDAFGRQTREYLPYAAPSQNGDIHINPLTELQAFYDVPKYDSVANPYSEKILEASPLNRVLKQAAPGAAWAADPLSDNDHSIKFAYDINIAGEVQRFEVSLAPGYIPTLGDSGFYEAGRLDKIITKDENWQPADGSLHTTEEFKDFHGRVVLKRTYNTPPGQPEGAEETYDTWYVYDKFGNLSFVIPPKVDTSDGVSATELNELCYQYRYDYRTRLIAKKLPGKGWEAIVYNKLDLPVFTQDQHLAAQHKWHFTKYDKFGRVAYSGLFNSQASRDSLQSLVNNAGVLWESKTNTPTDINTAEVYYTNLALPDTDQQVLSISYYDDYEFNLAGGAAEDAYGITPSTQTKGLLTGSKTRVLGTDQWITTLTYYDEKARPVYTYTRNDYLDITDKLKYKLDFTGRVVETTSLHLKDGMENITSTERFSYDRMGRLLRHSHQMADHQEEVLAEKHL